MSASRRTHVAKQRLFPRAARKTIPPKRAARSARYFEGFPSERLEPVVRITAAVPEGPPTATISLSESWAGMRPRWERSIGWDRPVGDWRPPHE